MKIHAVGKDVTTNGYGEEIKSAFKTICDALTTKYGPPKNGDFLKSGSIWNEPRDWTMGLLKKERELFAVWDWSNGSGGITLDSKAMSTEKGYVTLSYEFTGWGKYVDSSKADENKVF